MTLSVVIPMYNGAATILNCLEALAQQEELPDEVVVVDNNSTDNSREVVQAAAQRLKHLNITLCHEEQKGCGSARNRGVRSATGEIVAFTDTDCIPSRSWVKNMLRAFKQDPQLSGLGGIDQALVLPTSLIGKMLSAVWLTADYNEQALIIRKEDIFNNVYIVGFNCAFRKEFYLKLKGCDAAYQTGEDFDLVLRGIEAGGKMIAWYKDIVVAHQHDISLRTLLRREFFYAKGFVFLVNRHFRNNIFISTGHTHYHWSNTFGITAEVGSIGLKILLVFIAIIAVGFISWVWLIPGFLLSYTYLCFRIKGLVEKAGSRFTITETIQAGFFYLARGLVKVYGRLYWSFRYKVFCV